jgi:CRISPR-associated protein Cmr2
VATEWDDLLLAYLHDPPDKALSIRGHVPRARDNAKIAVGDHVSKATLEDAVTRADPLASIIERLPMPTAGPNGERAVGLKDGQLRIIHPLSAVAVSLRVSGLNDVLTTTEQQQLRAVVDGLPGDGEEQARNRFLAVWRLWPEALTENCDLCLARLPADTRTPDHTIWHHLDITAAFKAAEAEGHGPALLAFALDPVQRFIEAARSVRDLWSGSMILSWLAFRALLPVIEQLGPTALVYPALRGNPLLDLWLRDAGRLREKAPPPAVELRLTPSLPHRFLALVPWGENGSNAKELAARCRKAAACAWQEMADAVKRRVNDTLVSLGAGWDKRWDSQTASYFSTSTAVVPLAGSAEDVDNRLARLLAGQNSFAQAFKNAEDVRGMARSIRKNERPTYPQDHAGRWQYQVELVGRSLASQRAVRHIPTTAIDPNADERFPQKCTLLGSFEQMGPDDLGASKRFWDAASHTQSGLSIDGVRIRPGEALCAVALVKRFAGPAFFAVELKLDDEGKKALRFPDTWTVAAAEWLHHAEEKGLKLGPKHVWPWNGQWLHWNTEQDDPEEPHCPPSSLSEIKKARDTLGKPPVYYAILKLDGDDLAGWLRGEKSPKVRDVMHPDLVRYYEGLGQATRAGLDAKRPVGPALHAAISTALANFALRVIPDVVESHHGTVIYSGGDDTLVLLPASRAVGCALALRNAYTTDYYKKNGGEHLMMGSRATLSGGLVVVHGKDDLRLALQDARHAEKQAKESGKDALVITVRRRSGEHTSALCPWEFLDRVAKWVNAFLPHNGASDRWAYHLYAARSTLEQLPVEAMQAEIRRQIKRAEEPTPRLLPPASLSEAFEAYRQSSVTTDTGPRLRFETTGAALRSFLTLCHTASFLARGREG